ncbi:MAG: heavy metal translocating P-type ATPase [Halobacteriaceae archaeon]
MNIQPIKKYYRRHRKAIIVVVSGLLYGSGWILGSISKFHGISAGVLLFAAFIGGYDIAKTAYYEIKNHTFGIKTLVTLAAIGAIGIGAYWEAAAVVFLFSLGSYLEGRTMRKTRNALEELLEMTPDTAIVRRDGEQQEVPAREVQDGEVVIVKPGEKIPVDGFVVGGTSAVNQAPVTGESTPVHKTDGDEVYAGTINQEGALEIRTTGTGSDTTLQRIIQRVEEAQEAQSPTERLLDRFTKFYTPGVIILAIGAYILTQNPILSLTLLVIGCPGALVIGPPVSIVSAIGNAARSGVLMKGGEHLEQAGKIDLIAFDKTGTLTKGDITVADVAGFGFDRNKVLQLGAIAEKQSEHHLADAIVEAAHNPSSTVTDGGMSAASASDVAHSDSDTSEPSIPNPTDFDVIAGKGVIAHHDGQEIIVGNQSLLEEREIDIPEHVSEYVHTREDRGETAVHVVVDGAIIGVIALRDELREGASDVVAALHDEGIETVMLTGDNDRTARAVAEEVGIDEYRSELLPETKQTAIADFQQKGYIVGMVGDGINDAPSLATADIGIAMGAAGTDTAIETADMALMADDLQRIPYAVTLSKATRWNISENVGLAILTVSLLLIGVLTSYVTLAVGMLAHEASVLAVILNGMRLLRY